MIGLAHQNVSSEAEEGSGPLTPESDLVSVNKKDTENRFWVYFIECHSDNGLIT